MTATTLGDVDPTTEIDQTGIPRMPFSPYVKADMLEATYRLRNSNPIVFRAQALKLAILFHRVDPMINASKEEIQKNESDPFRGAFSVTWGIDRQPVHTEVKAHIGAFMMNAMLCDDQWGFVPWMRRKVYSQLRQAVFEVPVVPQFGLWRVRQWILGNTEMDMVWQLEPLPPLSSGTTGALGDPMRMDRNKASELERLSIRAIGGDWKSIDKEARRRIKQGQAHHAYTGTVQNYNSSTNNVSNQAKDVKSSNGKKRQKSGVYVFENTKPMVDGTVQSAGATTLSINEYIAHRMSCSQTAVSIGSAPMLVTEHAQSGAAERQGFSAAQAVASGGDAAHARTRRSVQADAVTYHTTQTHDHMRASRMSRNSHSLAAHYDPMTGQRRRIQHQPFFEDNHYDVPAGQHVVSQPMPVVPADTQALMQHAEELTAAAYGVTRSMALGDTSAVKAGAEINQNVAQKVIDSQGAKIAQMTEWLLNHIYHDLDTQELQSLLGVLDGMEHQDAEVRAKRSQVQAEIANNSRYHVQFAGEPPTLEQLQLIVTRGLVSRQTEASLSMAAIGLPPQAAELQDFPNPYDKAQNTETTASGGTKLKKAKKPGKK